MCAYSAILELTFVCSWFFGDTDDQDAISKLTKQIPGTFLIRFSSVPGWFTVSYVSTSGSVRHQRIKHSPGKYILAPENDEFPSLKEMVAQKKLLQHACNGSRFQTIFQEIDPSIEGYINGDGSAPDDYDYAGKD